MQAKSLSAHKAHALFRHRYRIDHRDDATLLIGNKTVINFTSNDYLGLANHPLTKKAFKEGVDMYGLGSGSAAFISGYFKSHQLLEEAFSEFLNRDRAILFNSGYHANLGVLTSLAHKNSVIIADKLCHASIIDGIMLSRAKYYRYRHQDLTHAKKLVDQNPNALLVTESVFSMQGSITDVKSFPKTHLIVDDAHGVGVLGKRGMGIAEHQHLTQDDVTCLITPLGKALGSVGAIVSGSDELIETILQFSRTYYYTTALPPAVSHATLASLNIMIDETWRRETLHHLIRFFIKGASERKLTLISTDDTPIKCMWVDSNEKALEIQKKLLDKHIFVSCIRPPTVPTNASRIRISLNCLHTESQITQLLDELYEIQSC